MPITDENKLAQLALKPSCLTLGCLGDIFSSKDHLLSIYCRVSTTSADTYTVEWDIITNYKGMHTRFRL